MFGLSIEHSQVATLFFVLHARLAVDVNGVVTFSISCLYGQSNFLDPSAGEQRFSIDAGEIGGGTLE